ELVELMLREIGDAQFLGPGHTAGERSKAPGEQLHQRRLAVAVGAEQRDAIVVVDPQRHPVQDRLPRVIADRDALQRDDRWRQYLLRRRERDLPDLAVDGRGNRLQLLEPLDAGLRLPRLRGLGAKAVDERLQVLALRLDPFDLS